MCHPDPVHSAARTSLSWWEICVQAGGVLLEHRNPGSSHSGAEVTCLCLSHGIHQCWALGSLGSAACSLPGVGGLCCQQHPGTARAEQRYWAPSSAWRKATEGAERVAWSCSCRSWVAWLQPGISQAGIPPEDHEVEAFSKDSCDALGAWGQSASDLSRRYGTTKELRRGCVRGKRAEKGSSRTRDHKSKSPFSRKRLLQLSVMLAACHPGEDVTYSVPQRQRCRLCSALCSGPPRLAPCPVVICV